jgi:hypothetical protein
MALGDQLADQPFPDRSHRRTDREFLPPRRGLDEQQVGDVQTRNQQHAAGRAHQHPQGGPQQSRRIGRERAEPHIPTAVRRRVRARQIGSEDVGARLRGAYWHSWLEPAQYAERAIPALLPHPVHIPLRSGEKLHLPIEEHEIAWQHADDGVRPVGEEDLLADRRRVRRIAPPPQAFENDHGVRAAGPFLLRKETAAEYGFHAQHREEARRRGVPEAYLGVSGSLTLGAPIGAL